MFCADVCTYEVLKVLVLSLVGWLPWCHILGQAVYFDSMARFRRVLGPISKEYTILQVSVMSPGGNACITTASVCCSPVEKRHKSYKRQTAWGSNVIAKMILKKKKSFQFDFMDYTYKALCFSCNWLIHCSKDLIAIGKHMSQNKQCQLFLCCVTECSHWYVFDSFCLMQPKWWGERSKHVGGNDT